MNPQESTLIQALLGQLSGASSTWYDALLPYARGVFFTLVGFQLLWTCITFALGRRQSDEFISMLFIMVIDVGFFYTLILHPDWVLDIINSFRSIGRDASGIERLSPDAIVDTGLRLASAILKSASASGLMNFAIAIVMSAIIAIAVLGSFAFIAARMVLILAEIFFAVNISPMLLAFSGLSATKYIATQYIGYVISAGIQLLVMYLLVGAGLDIATTWADLIEQHGSEDVNAFMLVGLSSALYAVLVWNLPKVIGGLASGAPQMSSGGYSSTAAGFGAGSQLGRAFLRAPVNGVQSSAIVARAMGANYATHRVDSGHGRVKSALSATGATLSALTATGVNSLLGRHGHRNSAERLWSSTAKLKAAASSSGSTRSSSSTNESEKDSASTGTTEQKVV